LLHTHFADCIIYMAKRKRKSSTQGSEVLSPEELERRRIQREKQKLALKLRAEGGVYNRRKTTRPPKWKREAVGSEQKIWSKQRSESSGRRSKQLQTKTAAEPGSGKLVKEGEVEVIVVPLFWKHREAEREAVTGAAQEVHKMLTAAGVRSFVDFSNKLNPGQKYRYWEERGVKLRVELGPKDLESNSCVLAESAKPGEVAKKTTLEFGSSLLERVGELLQRDLSLQGTGYVPQKFALPQQQDGGEEPLKEGGRATGSGAANGAPGAAGPSGDDLEDDFGVDLLGGASSPDGSEKGKKKRRKKKAA